MTVTRAPGTYSLVCHVYTTYICIMNTYIYNHTHTHIYIMNYQYIYTYIKTMHEHARVGSTALLNFAMARPLTFTLKPHCSGVSGMETSSDMLREKARPEMLSDFLRGPSKMFHVVVFWIQFSRICWGLD